MAAVLLLPVQANALSARQAVALEPVTGRHLFEREPAARARMASTTKIMTALLICEQCNVLDRMRIPKEAVGIEGSSMYLQEGEVLTLQFDAGDALEAVRHSSPEYAANEKMQQIASVMQNYPGIMLGGQLNK